MSAWWFIFAGVVLGTIGDYLLKSSHGFTHFWLGAAAVFLYGLNIILWGIAIKTLPLGISWVVWSGLGTLAAISVGIMFFGETLTLLKLFFIAMVMTGSVGLMMIKETT